MPAGTTSKGEWLARIERAAATWEEIVAQVDEAGMDRPGAAGSWSFKDVAGHLNGWRVRTVDRLEAAARDEAPPPAPWPEDLSDESDEGVEAINHWMYECNRDRQAAEILAESRAQFRRMRAVVQAISEDDLAAPGRFPWLGGEPLSAVIAGSRGHLHEEHEPALRAWLAERPR